MLARLPLSGLMLTLLAGVAFPSVGQADEQKEGMPQLDPHSYASQLFWLAVFFVLVFLFLRFVGLPRVTAIIDQRAKAIGSDIATAERLQVEAAEAEKTYEKTMAEARASARQLLAETHEQNVQALTAKTREATAASDRQVADAVTRIEAQQAEALKSIRDVALGLAADITAKLAGHVPSADRVAVAVDRAVGEVH